MSFSHEAVHLLGAIAGLHSVDPIGATLRDGYYCAEIVGAIQRAPHTRAAVDIEYRDFREEHRDNKISGYQVVLEPQVVMAARDPLEFISALIGRLDIRRLWIKNFELHFVLHSFT